MLASLRPDPRRRVRSTTPPLDYQGPDQGPLQSTLAIRRTACSVDRPDRCRQDLPRAGLGPTCLRQRKISAVTTWLENVALARSAEMP